MDEIIVVVVVVGIFITLVKDIVSPALAFLGGLVILVATNVISTQEAFSGFSNENLLTIGALFVITRGLENKISIDTLTGRLFGKTKNVRKGLLRIMAPVALSSAFVNNTPVVAMLINPVIQWSQKNKLASSKFLIPLSFAAIFGGALTLIGTSTNLVVSGLLSDSGMRSFSFFELTPYSLPLALVGLFIILLIGPRLIPKRPLADLSASEIKKDFTIDMHPKSSIVGKTVTQAKLRHLKSSYLIGVVRVNGDTIAPVHPNTVVKKGDTLRFSGNAESLIALNDHSNLSAVESKHVDLLHSSNKYVEVVVGHNKSIVGRTLVEIGFRAKYQAAVLAIFRSGEKIKEPLGSIALKPGDSLLVLADDNFASRWRSRNDFLYMREVGRAKTSKKSGLKSIVTILTIITGLLVFGSPLSIALLGGAIATVLFKLNTISQARESIDFDLLIMVAAAIGVAKGVELSGLAEIMSKNIISIMGGLGSIGLLFGVILATTILTEIITNAAAALLVFPIAVATAQQSSLDPRMFAIAIAITASLSFISPLGYQTNTMVYSAGAYKFHDFLRIGLILNIVSALLLTSLLAWSFNLSF